MRKPDPVMIEWRRADGLLGVAVSPHVYAITAALKHPKVVIMKAIDPELMDEAKALMSMLP